MIFCSYYNNVKNIEEQYGTHDNYVQISLRKGINFTGKNIPFEKKVMVDMEDFVEYKFLKTMDWKDFCLNYYEKLSKLSDTFWKLFLLRNNGKILLCHEKDARKSHRYLLGKFLYWKFGECQLTEIDSYGLHWRIEKKLLYTTFANVTPEELEFHRHRIKYSTSVIYGHEYHEKH